MNQRIADYNNKALADRVDAVNGGIRTGNKKTDGTTDASGETGTFRVDYFLLYRLGDAIPTYTVTTDGGVSPRATIISHTTTAKPLRA